jgi:hypothetical protein
MHNERSGASNMVWFITLLLRALLLDEFWTSTCLAKTVNTLLSKAQSEPRTCSIETAYFDSKEKATLVR